MKKKLVTNQLKYMSTWTTKRKPKTLIVMWLKLQSKSRDAFTRILVHPMRILHIELPFF
jgi:hypothetical protein